VLALALAALIAPAPARAAGRCWERRVVAGRTADVAFVKDAARNLALDLGVKRFARARGLGLIVTNGTFFDQGARLALGDAIVDGALVQQYPSRRLRTKDGRLVDLGLRWGLGVSTSGAPTAATGDEALTSMRTFLGGGIVLLKGGVDRTADNEAVPGRYGASFSRAELERPGARTALGATADGTLVVVGLPFHPSSGWATTRETAAIMRELGCVDAVLYDGGHAQGFAAGAAGEPGSLDDPPEPVEDANPSHLVFKACD